MSRKPLSFNSPRNVFYISLQIIAGLFFIGLYFFKTPLTSHEITEFGAVIKSKPTIVSSSDGHKSIEFEIAHCKYKMKIENAALEALGNRNKFLNEISIGDSAYISIENWNYQNVIIRKGQTRPLTGVRIKVYTFRSQTKDYIGLSEYNHYKRKDEFLGVLLGVGLLVLVLITILRQIPLSTFLEKNWWLILIVLFLTLIYSWYAFKI